MHAQNVLNNVPNTLTARLYQIPILPILINRTTSKKSVNVMGTNFLGVRGLMLIGGGGAPCPMGYRSTHISIRPCVQYQTVNNINMLHNIKHLEISLAQLAGICVLAVFVFSIKLNVSDYTPSTCRPIHAGRNSIFSNIARMP